MSYENALLIGGPKDGVRLQVIKGIPDLTFAELPVALTHYLPSAPPLEQIAIKNLTYRRVNFRSFSTEFDCAVFVLGDLDPLIELIKGYRQP